MAGKQELLGRLGSLKSEISALKRELGSISARKNGIYSKLEALRKEFRPLIESIKALKTRRDEHTASVKSLKTEREAASSVVKKTAEELKKVRQEKEKKSKELGIRKTAQSIAAEIERLEFTIETGALPFSKEQKLNKVIKEKKAELKNAQQLKVSIDQLRQYSEQLNSSKTASDSAHKELRLHASVSQKLHEEMLAHARKADEVKARITLLDKELEELKAMQSELKPQLDRKLKELADSSKDLDSLKAEEELQRKIEEEKILAEREKQLTEKIKSGKKLTNDDLMMLRG